MSDEQKLKDAEKEKIRDYITGLDDHEKIVVLNAIPTDLILDHLRTVFGQYAHFKKEVAKCLNDLGVATGKTEELLK